MWIQAVFRCSEKRKWDGVRKGGKAWIVRTVVDVLVPGSGVVGLLLFFLFTTNSGEELC